MLVVFFFKQKTAYEMRISDWSSDVCSSDLGSALRAVADTPKRPGSADAALHVAAGNYGEQIDHGQPICIVPGTPFPLRYVVMAAIHDLDRWIKTGVDPPEAPRHQFNGRALERDQSATP